MNFNKKILVFTATFNEISNISKLIKSIKKYSPKVDLLVIDDNSPDGTGQKILELKKSIKNLNFISRKKKRRVR